MRAVRKGLTYGHIERTISRTKNTQNSAVLQQSNKIQLDRKERGENEVEIERAFHIRPVYRAKPFLDKDSQLLRELFIDDFKSVCILRCFYLYEN